MPGGSRRSGLVLEHPSAPLQPPEAGSSPRPARYPLASCVEPLAGSVSPVPSVCSSQHIARGRASHGHGKTCNCRKSREQLESNERTRVCEGISFARAPASVTPVSGLARGNGTRGRALPPRGYSCACPSQDPPVAGTRPGPGKSGQTSQRGSDFTHGIAQTPRKQPPTC